MPTRRSATIRITGLISIVILLLGIVAASGGCQQEPGNVDSVIIADIQGKVDDLIAQAQQLNEAVANLEVDVNGLITQEVSIDDLVAQAQQLNEAVANLEAEVSSLTTPEVLKETLREVLDGLEGIQRAYMAGRSLNDFFNAVTSGNKRADLDEYWTSAGLTVGPGSILSAYTRSFFDYPALMVRCKLLPPDPDFSSHFGFQAGDDAGVGIFQLATEWMFSGYNLYLGTFANTAQIDVENLLPANCTTALHNYILKLNKYNGELWVDGVLKAIILQGLSKELPSWNDGPYGLNGAVGPTASSMPALVELNPKTGTYTFECDITKNYFAVSDGDPTPPRQFFLYTENTTTKWSDLTVEADTTLVSHPIPIWGYPKKTLMWMGTGSTSSATIEVYIQGAWRDSGIALPIDGTLATMDIPFDAPIVRIKITGGSGGGTINVAEIYLS